VHKAEFVKIPSWSESWIAQQRLLVGDDGVRLVAAVVQQRNFEVGLEINHRRMNSWLNCGIEEV